MKTLVIFIFVTLSAVSASIIGLDRTLALAAPGVAVQGPSSQAALAGPDGSAIAAATQGGTIITGPSLGGAILGAPAGLWAGPALTIPTGAVIAGPSGTIISNGLLAAPRLWIG